MKYIASLLFLSNCTGYSVTDADLTGQVKKIKHENPVICPEYTVVDVSLGFTKDGVGSMSTQDLWLVVESKDMEKKLHDAMINNKIVKVTYKVARLVFCTEDAFAVSVEELK